MKLTLSSLQRILVQIVIAVQGITTIGLVVAILFSVNYDAFAKQGNGQLIEDVDDNGPSKHPSGKDKNTEHGKSGTQGKSESNPDGNGADKRRDAKDGSTGGTQGSGDYDDNNGCGNDHDFADDNNGNCGGKPKPSHKPSPTPKPNYSPSPKPSQSPKPSPYKIKVCHATGSSTNPYVLIEISVPGVTNGHEGHSGDIIPAPDNGCPKPAYNPNPIPTQSPSSSPSPTPSPTPNVGSPNDPGNPSSNNSNSESSGKVLGVNVPKELPVTGAGLLTLILSLGGIPTGFVLSRYKRS